MKRRVCHARPRLFRAVLNRVNLHRGQRQVWAPGWPPGMPVSLPIFVCSCLAPGGLIPVRNGPGAHPAGTGSPVGADSASFFPAPPYTHVGPGPQPAALPELAPACGPGFKEKRPPLLPPSSRLPLSLSPRLLIRALIPHGGVRPQDLPTPLAPPPPNPSLEG